MRPAPEAWPLQHRFPNRRRSCRWFSGSAAGRITASSCLEGSYGDSVVSVLSSPNSMGGPFTCVGCAPGRSAPARSTAALPPAASQPVAGMAWRSTRPALAPTRFPAWTPRPPALRQGPVLPPSPALCSALAPNAGELPPALQRQRRRRLLPIQRQPPGLEHDKRICLVAALPAPDLLLLRRSALLLGGHPAVQAAAHRRTVPPAATPLAPSPAAKALAPAPTAKALAPPSRRSPLQT